MNRWALCVCCSLLLEPTTKAAAQQAPTTGASNADALALEEIVVTANRRAESLQDAPLTITALTGDDLIDRGVLNSQSLQQVTPGLFYGNNGNFSQPYIRGIGTSITVPGAEASVATFIDDVYQSQSYFTIQSLNAVERIEVLKGPQGALYGRNATGGAIRIQTLNPGRDLEARTEAEFGTYDYLRLSGYASVPLGDAVAANLAVVTSDRDGFGRILNGDGRVNSERYTSLRGKVAVDPTPDLTLLLTGFYYDQDDTANTGSTYADDLGSIPTAVGAGGRVTYYSQDIYSAYPPRNRIEAAGGNLRIAYDAGPVQITSVTSYSEVEFVAGVDFLSTDVPIFNFQAEPGRGDTTYQSLELLGETGGVRWTVGGNYVKDNSAFDPIVVFSGRNVATRTFARIDTEAYAVFAEATVPLGDRLSATAGVRYTDETKTQERVDVFNAAGVQTSSAPERDRSWSRVTYRGLVQYDLDEVMLFAKVETGFKSGTVNSLVPGGFIDPETVTAYEVGVKSDLFDRRLRLNVSGYYYDYKDLQQQYNDVATGASLLETAEKARIYGVEAQAEALVTRNLRLTLGANLMDATYRDFVSGGQFIPRASVNPPPPGGPVTGANAGNVITRIDVSGNDLTRAPTFTGTAALDWTADLGNGGALEANLSYYHSSRVYFDSINRITQPAYDVVGARLTYVFPGERFRVSAWARNLTDDRYIAGSALSATGDQIRLAPPRTYGLSAGFTL